MMRDGLALCFNCAMYAFIITTLCLLGNPDWHGWVKGFTHHHGHVVHVLTFHDDAPEYPGAVEELLNNMPVFNDHPCFGDNFGKVTCK